jgi:5-methylcytosine-specific restriction protein A
VADGEHYCSAHKDKANKAEQERRGTSSQRGYGRCWQRLRLLVLARDPVCRHPGCTELATDADHIVPRSQGGADSLGNLQGLCHAHHSAKTAKEDGGFGNTR